AIVTATPGTTRDLVTETVSLGGIPIRLIDTAGIRCATDEAESIGIRKSYEALGEADLVLVVLDSTREVSAEDRELLQAGHSRRAIAAANKPDLAPDASLQLDGTRIFETSAVTGAGIDSLRQAILQDVSGCSAAGEQEAGFLTNIRHQRLVEE